MTKHPVVYIMASKRNGTLYTGVTGNLAAQVDQHKHDPDWRDLSEDMI